MDVFPRWPLASWQLRVTSALSHPDPAPTQNAGLWPSPSKRTGHFKASSTHGSWDSLHEDRAWDRDWLFTQPCRSHPCTALPGKEGRNCQSHGWGSLPVSKQGPWEVACEGFSILLSLAWADACFETRRQKHNKNLPPSLPDLSISLWQTVISFFFPSRIFFSFSFKLSPGQRGKKALCSCPYLSNMPSPRPHHHSGKKFLPSPAAAKGELPNTTLPQPKHTLSKINIAFSFLFSPPPKKRHTS